MPPPTTSTSKLSRESCPRSRFMPGRRAVCAMCSTIVACRDQHRCARIEPGAPRAHVLGLAHPRSGHHAARGRLAGFLRRPRSVSLREAAPPPSPGRVHGPSRPARARCRLRHRRRPGALRPRRRARDRRRRLRSGHPARRRATWRTSASHAHLLVADGEALPFADASFDYVFAHGVVQYTADDARAGRQSAGACCDRADGRSSRCTTASPG